MGNRQFRHSDKPPPRISFADELKLASYTLPEGSGRFAGMTLDDVARDPNGLKYLRFVSRGTFRDEKLDAIRAYLQTINTWTPPSELFGAGPNP